MKNRMRSSNINPVRTSGGGSRENERKCMKRIYLMRDFYIEYIKNSYNLIIKRSTTQFKMD